METPLLSSLQAANLLPSTLIPQDFTPTIHLDVQFPFKPVANGALVRVRDVQVQPTISLSLSCQNATIPLLQTQSDSQHFTLMLLDPDAPTPDDPKFAYWRHWVVVNIPATTVGNEGEEGGGKGDVVGTGKTLTRYLAPGPKDESGPHRYLFLLFRQPEGGLAVEKGDVGGEEFVERRSFGAVEFVRRWGLKLVGVQWMRGVGDGWEGAWEE